MTANIDDVPIGFGKYTFNTPNQIADKDPRYLVWAYENTVIGKKSISRELYNSCVLDLEDADHTEDCASIY
jgi:hypothetical protein